MSRATRDRLTNRPDGDERDRRIRREQGKSGRPGRSGGPPDKWLVLVFWLVVVAVAGPLSGKLMGAEKNDASAWLPPKAESTQVLNLRLHLCHPGTRTRPWW